MKAILGLYIVAVVIAAVWQGVRISTNWGDVAAAMITLLILSAGIYLVVA